MIFFFKKKAETKVKGTQAVISVCAKGKNEYVAFFYSQTCLHNTPKGAPFICRLRVASLPRRLRFVQRQIRCQAHMWSLIAPVEPMGVNTFFLLVASRVPLRPDSELAWEMLAMLHIRDYLVLGSDHRHQRGEICNGFPTFSNKTNSPLLSRFEQPKMCTEPL
jgi:hypothetical protein